MKQPRIVYSMMARFGSSDSMGTLSAKAVQALMQADWLQQLLVGSYLPGSVPLDRTRQLGLTYRALRKLAVYDASTLLHALSGEVYDRWSSTQIVGGDLLHVWGNAAEHTIARIHALGGKAMVERASSHTSTQDRLLRDEYDRFGIRLTPTSHYAIEKALREFSLADFILVPSEFVYQSFLEHGFAPERLILCPFGVDVERFQPGPGDGGMFRAVFVGQVSLRKGAQYVLEAWVRLKLPNAELLMIGPIAQDMEAIAARHRGNPTIQWIGYTAQLNNYLGRVSAMVFPSIEEGSALVTYIGMACGLPLITTFNAGSVARDGQEGYLIPIRDVDALCQRIEQLYQDADLRGALGQAARRRVEAFSWPAYQERLLLVYRRCLNLA